MFQQIWLKRRRPVRRNPAEAERYEKTGFMVVERRGFTVGEKRGFIIGEKRGWWVGAERLVMAEARTAAIEVVDRGGGSGKRAGWSCQSRAGYCRRGAGDAPVRIAAG
jgi:hypothetical protein